MVLFAFLNGFLTPGVDGWGHLGGFIYGPLIGALILPARDDNQKAKQRKVKIIAITFLVPITVAFIIALFARPIPFCDQYDCANICSY